MIIATQKTCFRWQQSFSLSAFGKHTYCKICRGVYDKVWRVQNADKCKDISKRYYQNHREEVIDRKNRRRDANHQFIDQYLLAHPCVDCGVSDLVVLQFDHIRGVKIDQVSDMMLCTRQKIEQEIKKCDVRCANCHARKTHLERGYRVPPKVEYTWVEMP